MSKIEALTRQLVGNRRAHQRKRFVYSTTLRDERGEIVFKGKTVNLSCSGARLEGFPTANELSEGQTVQIEFMVTTKDATRPSWAAKLPAQIWRIDDKEGAFTLAVKFDRELPE